MDEAALKAWLALIERSGPVPVTPSFVERINALVEGMDIGDLIGRSTRSQTIRHSFMAARS